MSAIEQLDAHVAPELRPDGWKPSIEAAEEAAKERSTCGVCLARTYRQEECVCEDGGDAEDYDESLDEEIEKLKVTHCAASFYDPHGNHVETVGGTTAKVTAEAAGYLYRMVREGYPCSVIIEPEEG